MNNLHNQHRLQNFELPEFHLAGLETLATMRSSCWLQPEKAFDTRKHLTNKKGRERVHGHMKLPFRDSAHWYS